MPTQPSDFPKTFNGLVQLISHLRGPNGCAWDKQQTSTSLKRYLLEEIYELLEAIDEDDSEKISEELGDVLFNLVFQIQIRVERKTLNIREIFAGVIDKFIKRHPHVFGDVSLSGTDEIIANWEELKRQEQNYEKNSVISGIPRSIPALSAAQLLQDRASSVNFDWEEFDGVVKQVIEEVREFEAASSQNEKTSEMGDILFSLVNLSRWLNIDAEGSLRQANKRFGSRFKKMEELSQKNQKSLEKLDAHEKEALWEEAKKQLP